jgi:hypothetical protein
MFKEQIKQGGLLRQYAEEQVRGRHWVVTKKCNETEKHLRVPNKLLNSRFTFAL